METKKFHVGDVLSITTGRLLSVRGMDGVCNILSFMTGEDPFTHQLPRFSEECRPHLLQQFPQLATPELNFAVAELVEMLKTPTGKAETDKVILGWLSKLTCGKYGIKIAEMLEVQKLPRDTHEGIDPVSELAEKIPPDDIIIVRL